MEYAFGFFYSRIFFLAGKAVSPAGITVSGEVSPAATFPRIRAAEDPASICFTPLVRRGVRDLESSDPSSAGGKVADLRIFLGEVVPARKNLFG